MAPEYLAGAAAVLAAVLSAVSLYFTRRWQQSDLQRHRHWKEADEKRAREWEDLQATQEAASKNKVWALDNLKVALVDHINLSFKIGRDCTEAKLARASKDPQGLQDALDQAIARHIEYMDLMVYLRLFSTPSIVRSAERLHQSLDHLLDLTFADEIQGGAETLHQGRARSRWPD